MSGSPSYDLRAVQEGVWTGRCVLTLSSLRGAASMGISPAGVRACVLALTPGEFYKTMESEKAPGTWQDAYRTRFAGVEIYAKVQLDGQGRAVVVSFKRR